MATSVVTGFSHRGEYTLRSESAVPAALPDPSAAAAASATTTSEVVDSTAVNAETVQLVTAATILSHSDSDSDTAEMITSLDEDSIVSDPLAYLDDLTMLDADSLSLAIGILRQHQPVNMDESGVLLSERLRDLLVVLHQRPSSTSIAHSISSASSGALSKGDDLAESGEDDFWSGHDEWSDVRCALMSIGINASLEEDDEEDVWTLEEEGLARR